jgi:hypothetical protein
MLLSTGDYPMAKSAGFSFGAAPKVVEAPNKKASTKELIEMRHVKKIGALDWLITAATTLKDTFMGELKADMAEHFVDAGCTKKGRPDNFTGVEDNATASCQLRLKSSRSVLTDDEVALCEEMGVPYTVSDITTETFIFNPAYLGNAKLMAQIEAALAKIPGLPSDIIQHQAGKAVRIATDASIDAAFKLSPEKCALILPVVTTMAVSPKFEVVGGNIAPVMAEIASIMNTPELADVIANAKKKSSSKGE